MQSSKKSPIRDGTVLYTSNIPIIYPYYGFGFETVSHFPDLKEDLISDKTGR